MRGEVDRECETVREKIKRLRREGERMRGERRQNEKRRQ